MRVALASLVVARYALWIATLSGCPCTLHAHIVALFTGEPADIGPPTGESEAEAESEGEAAGVAGGCGSALGARRAR